MTRRAAYNLLSGLGENATASISAVEARGCGGTMRRWREIAGRR